MKRITLHPAKLREISWRAYLVRFVFGGLVTVVAGVIGMVFGPSVGGLFLAFPSIAVASLTLIEHNEGKNAVGADAAGTSIGSLGLLGFGLIVWKLAPRLPGWQVLGLGLIVWFALSSSLWLLWWHVRHWRH
ncbi:MAG TPA: DUF3147 family protein [Chloroflexota bacterium]|jgi:hypothetical protein|nr:DUF3147 family protein [Chloroflexota bacterium]